MKNTTIALFLLLLGSSYSQAITYVIPNTVAGSSGYGYSGTITTDGSVGLFTDTSSVIAWSITLNTPGGADGITTHVLNEVNSDVTSSFPEASLSLTATEFALTSATTIASFPLDNITFASKTDAAGDNIRFSPSGPLVIGAQTSIRDGSESPSLGQANTSPGGTNFVIGTAPVPEPSSTALLAVGAFSLLTFRKRKG